MDLKASSTAFDTVVFVLLVGVAVTALAGVAPRGQVSGDRVAEETADVLATSTTDVTYTRSVTVTTTGLLPGDTESHTVSVTRTGRGSYAQLLAAAALADPSLDGHRLFGTGGELRTEARTAGRRLLHTREANVQLVVAWRPYPDATFGSAFVVGDPPPGDADVSATTTTVPSGHPNASAAARSAAWAGGYGSVARVIARSAVTGLFPPSTMRAAMFSEGPDRALAAHRYDRAASVLNVEATGPLTRRNFEAANRRLISGLARRLESDLREQFDSPEAAARAASGHQVRIVVRTWSA